MKVSSPPEPLHASPPFAVTTRLGLGITTVCVLLVTTLFACTDGNEGPTRDEKVEALEAETRALHESLETLAGETAELRNELGLLRDQIVSAGNSDTDGTAGETRLEETDLAAEQAAHLAYLEEVWIRTAEGLDALEARFQSFEESASKAGWTLPGTDLWSKDKSDQASAQQGTVEERTARLAEDAGGTVHYLEHPQRVDRAVLVMPPEPVAGQTPLIVSLHGYGGDSASHATYIPLHERVGNDGFALLLPNGTRSDAGNRFWNPTDMCCDNVKVGQDDVAYLTALVARAEEVLDFGPVYFFGYSNGGFMSYHLACKGLPDLRAVASLAGTSYVDDSQCEGASPVSVLHIHGTEDDVIRFDGDDREPDPQGNGERAFYAGAREMVSRWSRRAGCEWPAQPQPYTTLDLDRYVAGSETQAFRLESGCTAGIVIELWMGRGSGHAPGYSTDFLDELLGWLLSQT